jgi:hypothetical protein
VLLVTLMLLVLVTLSLVAVARVSFAAALSVDDDQRQVQGRWAAISCQYTLLPSCERLLARRESQARGPVPSLRAGLDLGGLSLDLVLSDELAKVNVPALLARRAGDHNQAESDLRPIVATAGAAGLLRVRQPMAAAAGPASVGAMNWGLGEVFDLGRPGVAEAVEPTSRSAGASALVTCWGGGRLNWRRAGDAAMRLSLCPTLNYSQVDRLIAARSAHVGLGPALDQLGLDGTQRSAVEATLADGSSCHGLWVIARVPDRGDAGEANAARAPILVRQAVLDGSRRDVTCFNW